MKMRWQSVLVFLFFVWFGAISLNPPALGHATLGAAAANTGTVSSSLGLGLGQFVLAMHTRPKEGGSRSGVAVIRDALDALKLPPHFLEMFSVRAQTRARDVRRKYSMSGLMHWTSDYVNAQLTHVNAQLTQNTAGDTHAMRCASAGRGSGLRVSCESGGICADQAVVRRGGRPGSKRRRQEVCSPRCRAC